MKERDFETGMESGVWVKGCAWDKADPKYGKPAFEKYLGKKA